MYPSKIPVVYILHLLIVGVILSGAIYFGVVHLGQPLALLSLIGLKFMPDIPLVPEPEAASGEYDGSGTMGFLQDAAPEE